VNSRTTRCIFVALTVSVCVSAIRAQSFTPAPRQVAAPASDIVDGIVRLPSPSSTSTVSHAALFPLAFARANASVWRAEVALPIERAGDVALALLSPDAGRWSIAIGLSGSAPRPIAQSFAHEHNIGPAGDELAGWVVDRYDLHGVPAGTWTVRIEAPIDASALPPRSGWLTARTASDVAIETHVTTQRLVAGDVVGVAARATGDLGRSRVTSARVVFENAGVASELVMQDDGLHEDGLAGDGTFGALVPASLRGDVNAHVEITGTTSDGATFLRSAELAFPMLERAVALDGSARASEVDATHLSIAIGALPISSSNAPPHFHVSAEVWGRAANGAMVPVCWLSRQSTLERDAHGASFTLSLDTHWLDVAGAAAPLELREVRAQDPDTEVVFDLVDRIPLATPPLPAPTPGPHAITSEMLTGSALELSTASPAGPHTRATPVFINPALMLVHGYCSSGSIWPAADFAQPKLEFLDPNANRTHDQFAQLINAQAVAAHLSSFGVVTHSQGGCAALHLLTYYTSGLDFAAGGRRIQALAAPFQGTPLASLGAFACGVNNDMTLSGSATWLAGIPTWARAEVWYWTTSNTGSACNFLTDFFLTNPEDGTVEEIHGQLPSGNNMGHTLGWCHTTGMSNPASYTDHVRNQAMNAAASR
jgi:hypothetical protein